MVQQSLNLAYSDGSSQVLWEDGERVFSRGWRLDDHGNRLAVLLVALGADHPSRSRLDRLTHEYELKDELDGAWAARPLALMHEDGRTVLVLDDPGGEPLDRFLCGPMEIGRFLRLAIAITSALGKLHQRGLIHKDIKPANILVDCADGHVRLTGFGIASRLSRERQAPEPPETIAGTLAYMAPEQTGRMNRSVDARSDLYALGVTLYQMLTGCLPFTASEPMEWVHCHIARKPMPPGERLKNIPPPVAAIIMKLLAKTAEGRYQTAAGVERDLRRCIVEWKARQVIGDFPLGEQDTPDRLLIPEKLYGRTREVETLLAAFDRMVKSGAPELVLVSGYAGIGKSSVVNELHKALVPPRGLFAAGKFDQYKHDIPYATLAQAFQSLVRRLLGKSDAELSGWRDALREALGPNGMLMIDLVPELKLIIGEQLPVPELPPQDAQRRFQLVFRRFIGVFARPEHPLALFLDDLQWLDGATLDLLEDFLTQPDVHHLMVVGAYRDNEVDPSHPLMRKLDAIRNAGASIHEIRLVPLGREYVTQLVVDALHNDAERAAPLAYLVHEKTAGNPFFVIQFLHVLAEENLLALAHDQGQCVWDLNCIRAKGYTDNVVDLMAGKLNRLPPETQMALQQLACLGNVAGLTMLSIVLETSEEQVHAALFAAVRQELVERIAGAYRFVHDRIQEAAYLLIPEASRAEAHLRVGRLLAARTPPGKRGEAIFEIVNQLNRGAALITALDEREQLAEFNLIAGERAKASTAYASALRYFVAGAALLAGDSRKRRRDLIFQLELHRAACEYLTGALTDAEQRLQALSVHSTDAVEQATVACLRMDLYVTLDQSGRAVAVGLDYLRHLGIEWSPHPTAEEACREYQRIWSTLGDRTIEALVELPLMTDPASLATLDVLTKLALPALYTDANLACLAICRVVNLSLESGNCESSCVVYEWLGGMIAGPRFGDYQAGFRFGRLGYDLVEQRGLKRFQARTYMNFGSLVLPWTAHVRAGRELLRRAFEAANQSGDLNFAAHCCSHLNTNLLAAGDPLDEVQGEAERGLAFAQKMRFGLDIDRISTQHGLIRTLRGLTPTFGCFDDEQFEERRIERRFSENPDLAFAACWYWVRKLQARYFAGDYVAAVDASLEAQRLLWPSHFETAEYHFYGALSRAASCASAAADQHQQHLQALATHHRQLDIWATNCPENFENRAALVAAEIARIEGRLLDAERFYEKAIRSAHENGFVHNEAVANEVAARFYMGRGFEKIARSYLRECRHCYVRWGADGKVRQLDELYPQLWEESHAGPTSTIRMPVEHLDLATIINVSQRLAGEIVLETLLDTVIRTAIQHAGAERGLLILSRGADNLIAAEAKTNGNAIVVHLRDKCPAEAELPESVLQYVLRTQESVILDDALAPNPFSADPYLRQHYARSILCLPLISRAKLIGVLYLENNLVPRIFAPSRTTILKLIASQAAISLENSRLYRDVADREGKIRRLVDANIIGIITADSKGRILEANDAFLHILGYDREDLVSGRVRWTELSPPEWRERDMLTQAELNSTGIVQPFEKEYFRKNGSRVPVLIGAALLKEGGDERLAFVLDLTKRKRAEEALRASEAKFRAAMDGIAGLVAIMTPSGELESVNSPLTEYFGRTVEELKNWSTSDAVHPEDLPRVLESYATSLAAGTPFHHELRLRRFDGEYRWFENRGAPIRDESGLITRWYCLLTDIEDRTQALARLQQMQSDFAHMNRVSVMGELAASLSHEILHPIATARNNARAGMRFLEMNPPNLDEIREALACVVRDTDRAKDIVGRMRDHIKKAPLRKEHFDLNSAINEVIVLAQSVIHRNGVSVQTLLADGVVPVLGDRIQLQQVLLNLILNAAEAMGSVEEGARELLISTEQDQAGAVVAVRDSGPGIDARHLDRVFDAFYTTKSSGTGMGLAICRSIIHAHGGKLWVEANEPRGAVFQFTLPADNDS
ncbi:AAA family ATPase [Bradyrhizobium sp. STM 3557]|uniref:AAA family ATPase n=1 Tax=Bradyrhizobium sp. STM 3557 TaxID=578920 RepID=UPI00389090AC